MANLQKEDDNLQVQDGNYTRIHNRILEELAKRRLSGYEIKIIFALWRKTYGWQKKEDAISFKQFKEMTKLPKSEVSRTLSKLKKRNLVVENYNSNRRMYRFNKHFTTWKELEKSTTGCRKLQQELEKSTTGDVENYNSKSLKNRAKKKRESPKETLTKETITKESIYSLFELWNSLKIIIHKNIKKFEGALKSALRDYKAKEIKKAMDNYNTVLKGKKYFWTYKWTLKEFLQRGLEKFLDTNKPLENFLKKGERQQELSPVKKRLQELRAKIRGKND